MKVALLSDIHGNDIALRSALNDINERGGVDEYWVLGDLVAIGHAPIKVLEILNDLSNVKFIRGNTDRYVCTRDRPPPTENEVKANTSLLTQMIEVEGDFSWTQGAVTAGGWLEWFSNLPLQMRRKLPDGTTTLCVHASPHRDDGSGIHPNMREDEIEALLMGCSEDLICVGHTHQQFSIQVNDQMVINPGSISNHFGADVRASYGIIDANEDSYQVKFFRVDYDQEKVIKILEAINHPAKKFIIQHLRGERI